MSRATCSALPVEGMPYSSVYISRDVLRGNEMLSIAGMVNTRTCVAANEKPAMTPELAKCCPRTMPAIARKRGPLHAAMLIRNNLFGSSGNSHPSAKMERSMVSSNFIRSQRTVRATLSLFASSFGSLFFGPSEFCKGHALTASLDFTAGA
eukprot:2398777-Pyramimonas_sp.AAC.1